MLNKPWFKLFLPLFIAVALALLFFVSYNNYLLDETFVNLKISLTKLESATNLEEVRQLKGVLDDTFIIQITQKDFDLASALKTELSSQMAQGVKEGGQLRQLENMLEEIISKKEKEKTPFSSAVENVLAAVSPRPRPLNQKKIKGQIEKLKGKVPYSSGRALQDLYLEIVKGYLRLKDWDKADYYIQQLIKIAPQTLTAYEGRFYRGMIYKFEGKHKQAASLFAKIKNDLSKKWGLFASYQEADSLYQSGEKEKAVSLLQEIDKENPDSEVARVAKFKTAYIYSQSQSPQERRKARRMFRDLPPETALDTRDEEVEISPVPGYEEEILEFEKLAEEKELSQQIIDKIKEGFYLLKKAYFAKNKTIKKDYAEEAIEKFDFVLEKKPRKPVVLAGKALALFFAGQPEEAKREAAKVDGRKVENFQTHLYLGYLYYRLDLINQAIGEYERIQEQYYDSSLINYNLATLYLIKGNRSKAKKNFRRAVMINPKFVEAYNNLSYLLLKEKRYGAAEQNLKKAVRVKPDFTEGHYNLGIIYYLQGKYKRALSHFKRVKSLKGSYKMILKYIADIEN